MQGKALRVDVDTEQVEKNGEVASSLATLTDGELVNVYIINLLDKYDAKNIVNTVTANDANTDTVLIRLNKDIQNGEYKVLKSLKVTRGNKKVANIIVECYTEKSKVIIITENKDDANITKHADEALERIVNLPGDIHLNINLTSNNA